MEFLNTESRIASWQANVKSAGMDDRLWYEQRFWDEAADESEEPPHPQQLLAALQIFCWMFCASAKRAWVHLGAEMQAGKSGVANALIRLILQNADKLKMSPQRIFLLTGMSDDAWRKQTRDRVPNKVRGNVHHNGGLKKVQEQLRKLAAKDGLSNILIIFDESQVASAVGNRPNELIYRTIRELVPAGQWVERNIRFLTISATDPAKVMSMETCTVPCRAIRLQTTDAYQSVETLHSAGRIRDLETFGDVGNVKSMEELRKTVNSYETPLWHILRPRQGKTSDVEAKLRKVFPTARVVTWDSTSRSKSGKDEEASESTEGIEDINTLLSAAPETHSFILLKNMFYAAKTLHDEHVGVLWDRLGGQVGGDNARLQSLLGRACGYGKSKRTVVYTSNETVERYLTFWKELCHSADAETETTEHKSGELNRRMPGVVAVTAEDGTAKVGPAVSAANPAADSSANAIAAGAGKSGLNEDDYDVEWREFASFPEAKLFASRVREPKKDDGGFYLSSTTGKATRLSYADVLGMRGLKKTAGFCVRKDMELGKSTYTMYVCYRDLADVSSACYVVGKLTRTK